MLDIYIIWASLMLLIVVLSFSLSFWALIAIGIFAIFLLVVIWKRIDNPDDEEFL